MNRDFAHQITTPEFSRQTLIEDIDNIIRILKKNDISTANVLFGYAWNDFFHNRKEIELSIDSLQTEIQKAEQAGCGELGDDDLHIFLDDFEIRYCHHGDIHLLYNDKNDLINEIIKSWLDKNWTLT